jgi:hypothetical protein
MRDVPYSSGGKPAFLFSPSSRRPQRHKNQPMAIITKITTSQHLKYVGITMSSIWIVAFLAYQINLGGLVDVRNDMPVGKDFLAYYASGIIVSTGQGSLVYDAELQKKTQADILYPEKINGFYYFINPASVAVIYSLLARLSYRTSFYLQVILMAHCYLIGMLILKPWIVNDNTDWVTATLLAGSWFPLMHSIQGGQTTALVFLLIALIISATINKNEYLAGIASGLMLFKPQYALWIIVLLLLKGKTKSFLIALALGGIHYVIGALYCGWAWPLEMLRSLGGYYYQQERIASGPTHIAFLEVWDFSMMVNLERWGGSAALRTSVQYVGWILEGFLILWFIKKWRRDEGTPMEILLYWGLAVAMVLILSLHSQYYDAALLIIPVLLIIGCRIRDHMEVRSGYRLVLIIFYLLFPFILTIEVANYIYIQPVIIMPIWVAWWALKTIKERGTIAPKVNRLLKAA